jgi:hypothetical protein
MVSEIDNARVIGISSLLSNRSRIMKKNRLNRIAGYYIRTVLGWFPLPGISYLKRAYEWEGSDTDKRGEFGV